MAERQPVAWLWHPLFARLSADGRLGWVVCSFVCLFVRSFVCWLSRLMLLSTFALGFLPGRRFSAVQVAVPPRAPRGGVWGGSRVPSSSPALAVMFLIVPVLVGVRRHLSVTSAGISLMADDTEHLPLRCSAVRTSSRTKRLFRPFVRVSRMGLFVFPSLPLGYCEAQMGECGQQASRKASTWPAPAELRPVLLTSRGESSGLSEAGGG